MKKLKNCGSRIIYGADTKIRYLKEPNPEGQGQMKWSKTMVGIAQERWGAPSQEAVFNEGQVQQEPPCYIRILETAMITNL